MSNELKIEQLEDLLTINTDLLKSPEKSRLLTRIKQLIKADNKVEANQDEAAKDLPYRAVSIVGKTFVEIKFDLESKTARVTEVNKDERDINNNFQSGARAVNEMRIIVKNQKELNNE